MRLIDADVFKKILSEYEMKHNKKRSFDDYAWGASNAYEHASDLLDEMPTVERPHGEWKNGVCTNCGAECFEDYYMRDIKTEFCHRCGADMRGVKRNDQKRRKR